MSTSYLRPLVRPQSIAQDGFPDDIKRLRDAINFLGFDASDVDIADAYEDYSEREYAAGWLSLNCWESDNAAASLLIKKGYLIEPKSP